MIPAAEIAKDIDLILWSAQLKEVYRYQRQRFWEEETAQHEQAMKAYPAELGDITYPRSESDAEHSWHMADIAMIIGPRFPQLDIQKCVMLAVIHDKLEIITGDADPLGKNGDGKDTHAFNADMKALKKQREKEAYRTFEAMLSDAAKPLQQALFAEEMALTSQESLFIKALDRLQPLTYIIKRKNGQMHNDHIRFSIKQSGTCKDYFPAIAPYHEELIHRVLTDIAAKRQITLEQLKKDLQLADQSQAA